MKAKLGITVQSRQLGRHLRTLRVEARVGADDAAKTLRVSPPTLYRYEAGISVPRPGDVRELCLYYEADDKTSDALVALAGEATAPGWWRSYNGAVPKFLEPLVVLETVASRIRAYDAEVVIGLLQTKRYADAMVGAVRPALSDTEREHTVSARLERQRLVTRPNPPKLDVVIGEPALRRDLPAGVLAEQIDRLDEVSRLPNVTLRILESNETHCGLPAGARFDILEFPPGRNSEPTTIYVESLTGALYLDKPVEVEAYDMVWQSLPALSPAGTRAWLSKRRQEVNES